MKIVDLNLLIYAVDKESNHHVKAKEWLELQLNGTETVGLPWVVLLGFLRIMTNGRIFPKPLSVVEAANLIDAWLANPLVQIPDPEPGHWNIAKELMIESGTAGNLTSDVHLASIAIGHGAKLFSLDADFSRFRGLRWERPF